MPAMPRRGFLSTCAAFAVTTRPTDCNVKDYGATARGDRLDTAAIQSAIDTCAKSGGGTVYFPAGRYLSGAIFLRSHVTLHLAAGATLLGSTRLDDYPVTHPAVRSFTDTYTGRSLIYAEQLQDITIEGAGVIDGQGAAFEGPYLVRPYTMRIVSSRNVRVSGITLRNSPMWVQHYLDCQGVHIHGITVSSRANKNNDGIDIDSCDRVRISDCDISSLDDALVLKSTTPRPTRNVTISNCTLSSLCNALKLGTESNGGFENITISNCAIYDTRLSGIALESVDGGTLERVLVSGITMNGVGTPIFVRLGDRGRPHTAGASRPSVGRLRQVILRDILATRYGPTGCAIAGLPDHCIEDVTFDNIRLQFAGGGKPRYAPREIPEFPEKYPEYSMFGILPAHAFYLRHIRGIRFRNVVTSLASPDERPAFITEDVQRLEQTNL